MTAKPRIDLHRTLQQIRTAAGAVICTYRFDPIFFEDYCLEKFGCLHRNNNITVLIDWGCYDELLSGTFRDRPNLANIRYLLQPITAKRVFHPKVFLFADEEKGSLLIGSANATRPGLTSNAELVGVFHYEQGKKEDALPIFRSIFGFLSQLCDRAGTQGFRSNLQALQRDAPWLSGTSEGRTNVEFLHNLERSLLDQIAERIGDQVVTITAISRFFDADHALIEELAQRFDPNKIRVVTQNRFTTLQPDFLAHDLCKSERAEVYLREFEDDGHNQPLHAKAILFETKSYAVMCYGSANLTSAALNRRPENSNVESMIAIRLCGPEERAAALQLLIPNGSTRRIRSASELQSSAEEDEPSFFCEPTDILLREAELSGKRIRLGLEIVDSTRYKSFSAAITFRGHLLERIAVNLSGGIYSALITDSLEPRLQQSSCVVQVEAYGREGSATQSNSVLLTNLRDISTGDSTRRARYVKEAQESATQFYAVLADLINGSDDDALKVFLSFCDIPITLAARPMLRHRAEWSIRDSMRSLGTKNFQLCRDLHEAVLQFCDRHMRKLRRHITDRDIDGVPNFVHIFLAINALLRSQIERVVQGLEARDGLLSTDEWAMCRELCNVYYERFREITSCFWTEYLEPMRNEHPEVNFHELLAPDLDAIKETAADMLAFRDRIEGLRRTKCILPATGALYGYFYSILAPEPWARYKKAAESAYLRVQELTGNPA
jgi:HKD family nuclease